MSRRSLRHAVAATASMAILAAGVTVGLGASTAQAAPACATKQSVTTVGRAPRDAYTVSRRSSGRHPLPAPVTYLTKVPRPRCARQRDPRLPSGGLPAREGPPEREVGSRRSAWYDVTARSSAATIPSGHGAGWTTRAASHRPGDHVQFRTTRGRQQAGQRRRHQQPARRRRLEHQPDGRLCHGPSAEPGGGRFGQPRRPGIGGQVFGSLTDPQGSISNVVGGILGNVLGNMS